MSLTRRAPPPGLDKSELRSIFRCSNCSNYINFLRMDKALLRCRKFHYLCPTCYWKTESCPLDNCVVGALYPDKNVALPSFWNVLKFRCLLSDHGCDAIVKAEEMQEHLKNGCPFRHLLVKCPHGYCNKLMPKTMLLDHVSGVHNRPLFEERTNKLAIKIDFKEPDCPNSKPEPETKVLRVFRYFGNNFLLMAHFFHESEFDAHYVYAVVFPEVGEEAGKFKLAVRFHGDTKFEEVPVVNYERAAIDIIRDEQAVIMKTHYCRTITSPVEGEIGVFLPLQFGILEVTESVTAVIKEKTFWFDGDPKLKKMKYDEPKPGRVKPNRGFADARSEPEQSPASVQTDETASPRAIVMPKSRAKQDKDHKFVSFLGTADDEPETLGSGKMSAKDDVSTSTAKAPATERKIQNVTIKSRSNSKIVQGTSAPEVRLPPPPMDEKKASRKAVPNVSTPDATPNGTPNLSELCPAAVAGIENVSKKEPRKYVRPTLKKNIAAGAHALEPSTKKAKVQTPDPPKTATSETKPKVTVPNTAETKPSEEHDKIKLKLDECSDSNAKGDSGQTLPTSIPKVSVPKDECLLQENADSQNAIESAADIFANDDQPEREIRQVKIEEMPVPEIQTESFADFNNLESEPARPEDRDTKDSAAIGAFTESVAEQPAGPELLSAQDLAVTSVDEPKLETAGGSTMEESETVPGEVCLGLETEPEVEYVEDGSAQSVTEQEQHVGEAVRPEAPSANLAAEVDAEANPTVELRDHFQPDEEPHLEQLDSSDDNAESAKAEPNTNQDEGILLLCHEMKKVEEVKDEPGKSEITVQIDSNPEDPQSNFDSHAEENNVEPSIENSLDPNLDGNEAKQDNAKYPVAIQDEIEIKAEQVHASPAAVEVEAERGLDVSSKDDSDENVTSTNVIEGLQIKNEVKREAEDSRESSNAETESAPQVSPPETESTTVNVEELGTAGNESVQDQDEVNKTQDTIHPQVFLAAAESALNLATSDNSGRNEPEHEEPAQELGTTVEDAEVNQQNTWSVSGTIGSEADAVDVPSLDNADSVQPKLETTETTGKQGNVTPETELVAMKLEQGLEDEVGLVPASEPEDVQEKINVRVASSEKVEHDIPLYISEPVEEADGAQIEEPYLTVKPPESDSLIGETSHLMNDTVVKALTDGGKAGVQIQEQSKVEETLSSVSDTSETVDEPSAVVAEDVTREIHEDSAPNGATVLSSTSPIPTAEIKGSDNHTIVEKHDPELEGRTDEPVLEKHEQAPESVPSDTKNVVENAQAENPLHNVGTESTAATCIVASEEIIKEPVLENMQESAVDLSEIKKEPGYDPLAATSNAPEQPEQPMSTAEEASTFVLPDVPTTVSEINLELEPATDPEQDKALNDGQVPCVELEVTESPAEEETVGSQLHLEPHTINNCDSATLVAHASEVGVSLEPSRTELC